MLVAVCFVVNITKRVKWTSAYKRLKCHRHSEVNMTVRPCHRSSTYLKIKVKAFCLCCTSNWFWLFEYFSTTFYVFWFFDTQFYFTHRDDHESNALPIPRSHTEISNVFSHKYRWHERTNRLTLSIYKRRHEESHTG